MVTWNLTGRGSLTRLTIVHSGFGDDAMGDGYADTWRALLGRLREELDYGAKWE